MKAVCTRHANCGRSRSCRNNRPIGELWAFLDFMHSPQCVTKADHVSYVPSHQTRLECRGRFKSLEGVAEFLEAEAVIRGIDEPA
eukprot:2668054-Amphidinium_carterae.1